MTEFGYRLREAREAMNLTQAKLGEAVGKSKNCISLYEHGTREPDLTVLLALANRLSKSLDALFGLDTGDRYPNRPAAPSLRLREQSDAWLLQEVPLYRLVAPGFTRHAEPDAYVQVSSDDTADGDCFFIYAWDDALSGARIQAGDRLLLVARDAARSGDIALLTVDGKPLLRIVQNVGSELLLLSTQKEYPLQTVSAGRVHCHGVVRGVSYTIG